MKEIVFIASIGALFICACNLSAQSVPERLKTGYTPLDKRLARMVTADTFSLSPQEARTLESAIFLDARETDEYMVSHIPGARHIGYDDPDYGTLTDIDKQTPVVVYCTIGYRSERMAEELKSRGYSNVYNLYGSIYAWLLAGHTIVDSEGPTHSVHTYNAKWGTYLPDSLVTKVY